MKLTLSLAGHLSRSLSLKITFACRGIIFLNLFPSYARRGTWGFFDVTAKVSRKYSSLLKDENSPKSRKKVNSCKLVKFANDIKL